MKQIIALILVMATMSVAETLPDAPSVSMQRSQFGTVAPVFSAVDSPEAPHLSFAERHRKAIIWGGLAVGGTIGAIVGILKHNGNCPSRIFYEGKWYPYSGSYDDQHACPTEPPGMDPGRR